MSKLTLSLLDLDSAFTTVQELGDTSGTVSVDISAGQYVTATATGAVAWTFTVPTEYATKAGVWYLRLANGGTSQTFAFDNGSGSVPMEWPSGVAPSLSSSGTDVLKFSFDPVGAYGRVELSNMS